MFVSGLIIILPALLIAMEPDIGTASLFGLFWLIVLFGVGINLWYFAGAGTAFALLIPTLWPRLKDYQQERILTFLDPTRDPRGSGYNVIQAMIAIGSGGIWGLGLGKGRQSQLKFLPVRHTDFIFSVIAEELGSIGPLILFVLYGVLLFRIIQIAQNAQDNFGRYLCIGVFALLVLQIMINVGMNLGLMPVTGVTLPLISYGGSSLTVTFAMLGLAQSVHIHNDSHLRSSPKSLTGTYSHLSHS